MDVKTFSDAELTDAAQRLAVVLLQMFSKQGMSVGDLTSVVAVAACEVHCQGYQSIAGLERLRTAIDVCERDFLGRLQ